MKLSAWRRALTPAGWMAAALAAAVAAWLLAQGLGFRWDPFDRSARRLEAARGEAEAARSEASARRLESEGRARQIVSLDREQARKRAAGRATAAAIEQTRALEDANDELELDRAERLRAHDGELCELAPDLAGCAAPAGPA